MPSPRILLLVGALLALPSLSGCEDPPSGPGVDLGGSDGAGGACTSFASTHEELLNAPTSATVIAKTPALPSLPDLPPP